MNLKSCNTQFINRLESERCVFLLALTAMFVRHTKALIQTSLPMKIIINNSTERDIPSGAITPFRAIVSYVHRESTTQ
jgi:superfamily I DNA and/or RNA helicase